MVSDRKGKNCCSGKFNCCRIEREKIEKKKLANILYGDKKDIPEASTTGYNNTFQTYTGAPLRGINSLKGNN